LKVPLEIPARPAVEVCAPKPLMEADLVEGKVVLSLEVATRLRDWIEAYQICTKSNEAKLSGHIEKLENRLKAVGGK